MPFGRESFLLDAKINFRIWKYMRCNLRFFSSNSTHHNEEKENEWTLSGSPMNFSHYFERGYTATSKTKWSAKSEAILFRRLIEKSAKNR